MLKYLSLFITSLIPLGLSAQLNTPPMWLQKLDASHGTCIAKYNKADALGGVWSVGNMRNYDSADGLIRGKLYEGNDTIYMIDKDHDQGIDNIYIHRIDSNGKTTVLKSLTLRSSRYWMNGFEVLSDGGMVFFADVSQSEFEGTSYSGHVIVNIDKDGNTRWVQHIDGGAFIDSQLGLLTVDKDDNVYVSGIVLPISQAGGIVNISPDGVISPKVNPQVFIAKWSASGELNYTSAESTANIEIIGLHLGTNNSIWANADFPTTANSTTVGEEQIQIDDLGGQFLISFNQDDLNINKLFQPFSHSTVLVTTLLPSGKLNILNYIKERNITERKTEKNINFDEFQYENNYMVTQFSDQDTSIWNHKLEGRYSYSSMDSDSSGNVILSHSQLITWSSENHVAHINSDGTQATFRSLNDECYGCSLERVSFDPEANIIYYLRGGTELNMRQKSIKYERETKYSTGMFFAKTFAFKNTYSEVYLSGCNEVEFHNEKYSESGQYEVVIDNTQGGDSIITLYVSIYDSYQTSFDTTVCGMYMGPDGYLYTESGTYTYNLLSIHNCDSTVTVNLAVKQGSYYETFLDTIVCDYDSYISPVGNRYTESGKYYDTIPAANGCDSLIVIDLEYVVLDAKMVLRNDTIFLESENTTYPVADWYKCGEEEPFAKSRGFWVLKESGEYYVEEFKHFTDCKKRSECETFNYVGIKEVTNSSKIEVKYLTENGIIQVYNPNNETLHLSLSNPLGQILIERELNTSENIKTNNLSSSELYIISITTKKGISYSKCIKVL